MPDIFSLQGLCICYFLFFRYPPASFPSLRTAEMWTRCWGPPRPACATCYHHLVAIFPFRVLNFIFVHYIYNHLTGSMFYSFDVHYFDYPLSSPECKLQLDKTCLICSPVYPHSPRTVPRRDATGHFPMNKWEKGRSSKPQETSQGCL